MARYRHHLPQLDNRLFITDGGLETFLVFIKHMDLPAFAAVTMLRSEAGRRVLSQWYRDHAAIAVEQRSGFILESATWRAGKGWARVLGISEGELADLNRESIRLMAAVRDDMATPDSPMVLSGCLGPRGDGYRADQLMSADESADYHRWQVELLAETDADMLSALTMTHADEAEGIVRAAQAALLPVVVSFTVETDGRVPDGQPLGEAIQQIDDRTHGYPAYYMINCAHPEHFLPVMDVGEPWLSRLRGVRANASRRSHAELDNSTELDAGDPVELGGEFGELVRRFAHINVVGGCCGTDPRHVARIAWASAAARSGGGAAGRTPG